MLQDIQEAIRKNLPGEVGDQLKKHLADADKWKADAEYKSKQVESLTAAGASKDAEIAKLKADLVITGDLSKREKEVTMREIFLELTLARAATGEAEKRSNDLKELIALAFRNPRIVKMTQDSGTIPLPPGAGQSYPGSGSISTTKTETEQAE